MLYFSNLTESGLFRYKKNLKQLFIVNPTFWIKTMFGLLRPILSSKFWAKLVYIDSPEKLAKWMDPAQSQLPSISCAKGRSLLATLN